MKQTASRISKRMKRQPSNKIEDSFPSLADLHAGQFGKYAGIEKLVAFFAERPENEWPHPTPAELAQIAVSLGDGTDWDSWNAVKVVWECARAQEDMIARVLRFMKTGKERKQMLNWIEKHLELKEENFPCAHRFFLSRLPLGTIQTRPGVEVRGHALWIEFLRSLPAAILSCRTGVSESDSQLGSSAAKAQSIEAWDAQAKRDGWENPYMLMWFAQKFFEWQKGLVSENKRRAAKTGKKGLERVRFDKRTKQREK